MGDWYNMIERRFREFYESLQQDYVKYLREKQNKFQYICIWGVGNLGRPTAIAFKQNNLKVDFYCDNDQEKWGKEFDGIICLSINELEAIKDKTLIFICARAYGEIFKQLTELHFQHLDRVFVNKFAIREYLSECKLEILLNNVKSVLDICADEQSRKIFTRIIFEWLNNESGDLDDICTCDQYFCDICELGDDEVFVDCGAYDGDTMQEFLKVKGNKFQKLILFELSQKNFQLLKQNVNVLPVDVKNRIEIYNKGVSNKNMEIRYEELDESSSEKNTGATKGYLVTIDEICKGQKITYIKMDVEGSEMFALKGAEQCILANKPKLAVCLYHNPQDIWEIPLFIKKILPDYNIYIRHHTNLLNETVCYAVI